MNDLEMATTVAKLVKERGGSTYFVGGYVRDKIMGRENKDIDIEVHGIDPSSLELILSSLGKVELQGASFGVYNIHGFGIDIALPRTERKIGSKHTDFKATVDPDLGLQEAARRRDFTINALMEDVLTGQIIDFWGGVDDLNNHIIRHVDSDTFKDDALRVLRAAQFAARFEFEVAEETIELCKSIDLSELSRERIFSEMEKALLKAEKPSIFFETLRKMEQLDVWFPELKDLIGTKQNEQYHKEGDVWVHTMMVLDEAAKRRNETAQPLALTLSALCHDLGKPVSTSVGEDGVTHSYQHDLKGVSVVDKFMRRISNDKNLSKYLLNMTRLHMRPNIMAEKSSKVKSTNKMFDEAVAPDDLILLSECDDAGRLPSGKGNREFLLERLKIYHECMAKPHVTGNDLIAAGLTPGVQFSEILKYAHKLRLAGVDKEGALKQTLWYARKMH